MPRFRTVLLDCDSTLSDIEGIDELAAGHRSEVARLTDAAMRGELGLEEVYGRRLDLVKPTSDAINLLGRRYVERLVPDAVETVAALQAAGVEVRIISGGLLPAVAALARAVGVSADRVAAVDVYFDSAGRYVGFDSASPLSRSGGKRIAIEHWSVRRPSMMVGDGSTDLEARSAVDSFVAFAGIVERTTVVASADAVIRARSLAPLLPLVLTRSELVDASHIATFDRGAALGTPVMHS